MRRLISLVLVGFLLFSIWFFVTRTPFPSEKARDYQYQLFQQNFDWDALNGDFENPEKLGTFDYYQGTSSHNQHYPRQLVLFLPSLGREASDFIELSRQVELQGYSVESLDFPSLRQDKVPIDLEAYAKIFAPAFLMEDEKIYIVGHAYGNRVARKIASLQPDKVKAVILLAAGGQIPMEPKAEQALRDIFNPMKSHKARMEHVRYAFFADGNEITDYWKRGWHTKTAMAQAKAVAASAGDDSWHCAGGVPMLIVQPMQDRIAPIENAYALRDKCPQEVEIVEVENAGHALLPEQPEAVAEAVLAFLAKHHPVE